MVASVTTILLMMAASLEGFLMSNWSRDEVVVVSLALAVAEGGGGGIEEDEEIGGGH